MVLWTRSPDEDRVLVVPRRRHDGGRPPTGEQAEHLTVVFSEMDARIGQPVHYGRGDSTCGTQAYQTHWTDEADVTTT